MCMYTSVRELLHDLDIQIKCAAPVIAYSNSGKACFKKGHELHAKSFQLIYWGDREETLKAAGYNLDFAEQDFKDRLEPYPVNPGKAIEFDDSGVLASNLDEKGRLSYTYSERMYFQLERIIQLLKDHPDTRQAYLSIWNPVLDLPLEGSGRVPCSLGYYFFIRQGQINMIYLMRSLNTAGYIGNDIYTSTRLLEYMADRLELKTGYVEFFACNLHHLE